MDKLMTECRECGGAGGTFEDRWAHPYGHYTVDSVCGSCEGSGETEALCDCGAPAVVRLGETWWMCGACRADGDGQAPVCSETPDSAADRIPTLAEGVEVMQCKAEGEAS